LPITSPTQFLTEIVDLDVDVIPLGKLAFFREQLRHQLHQLILRKFIVVHDGPKKLTKRRLASRIHRQPEVITRLLGAPGNLTLDTLSDLLIGMGAVLDGSFVANVADKLGEETEKLEEATIRAISEQISNKKQDDAVSKQPSAKVPTPPQRNRPQVGPLG
jgi:hypothetical protein